MKFSIGPHMVGDGRTLVIAEIGNNHNGMFDRAIEMIDRAAEMGADCAKFQMRHLRSIYRDRTLRGAGDDLGTEYVLDLLRRFELPPEQHRMLAAHCAEKGIIYMCTPWDDQSVAALEAIGVPAYKVASADLTNLPLLETLASTGKPLIISTGMSTLDEIRTSIDLLNGRKSQFALLHCNSTYPAPFHDINLRWINSLREFHPLVGYSGHERGTSVSLAAAALGACIIERHFTLDRSMEGPDHAASLEPTDFGRLVEGIREIEQALGSANEKRVSQGEMINRENLAKSLVSARTLNKGTILRAEDIKVRSPGQGLSPQHLASLVGRQLTRDMDAEDFFFASDLGGVRTKARSYQFQRPWGIPVRYHDFKDFTARANPDFFEFHLSSADLELDPAQFLSGPNTAGFAVHAPELFTGSRLMDLASPDAEYRGLCIRDTQRVVDITRGLKRYFPNTVRPVIVANIGGFSRDAPLNSSVLPEYYERFATSLHELDLDGVELIPQTMAPFPWQFGGQRFQNLFVTIDGIAEWCTKLGLRMCFDVSHSRLTCNHFGLDFYDFAERIAPLTAHLHMGDASGLNGEGLQIGDGDIDFRRLGKILRTGCPTASFIPEIWQGHKDGGEGFWLALERLENSL